MTPEAPRLRGDDGQTSVEFLGVLPFLLLAALAVWQLLLAASTATSAEHAARNASRELGRGGDGAAARAAAIDGLSPWLRGGDVEVARDGERVDVRVPIPVLLPGLTTDRLAIRRDAELPDTSDETAATGGTPSEGAS